MIEQNILKIAKAKSKSLSISEYARLLKCDENELIIPLKNLVEKAFFRKNRNNRYVLLNRTNFKVGIIDMTKKGFAFLVIDETEDDIFIHKNGLNGAMNGDKVLLKIKKFYGRREGEVRQILERRKTKYTGKVILSNNFAFVEPNDRELNVDIYIGKKNILKAKNGDIVTVEIIKGPKDGNKPEGKIIEILGNENSIDTQKKVILTDFDITTKFPNEVEKEVLSIDKKINYDNRVDLRDELILTIDGADSKDLDDAISIKKHNDFYELGVHIADVSYYVKEGSSLDKEALKRSTSVYIGDSVVPMLPKELSNGLCSLNPDEEKFCLSLNIKIDRFGKIISHDIFNSVIKSSYRLVYDDVSDFIEYNKNAEKFSSIKDTLFLMNDLSRILRKKRFDRGAIDFDFNESKMIFDKKGNIKDILLRDRRIANMIIEEFMILANEVISEHFFWLEIPFLYRVHEKPDVERLTKFKKFIKPFGYSIKGDLSNVEPKSLNILLNKFKGTKEEHLLSKLLLRSLKQAKYSTQHEGHFGLASKYYSHFTSPIRRYPDLQIHRIIKEFINGKYDENRKKHYQIILDDVAKISSENERKAEKAERKYEDYAMAHYMKDKIGDEFCAYVSGVTSFGIFAELENTVEGLIRVEMLKGKYSYDEQSNSMRENRRGGRIINIGNKVQVKCVNVDLTKAEIDFEVVKFYE